MKSAYLGGKNKKTCQEVFSTKVRRIVYLQEGEARPVIGKEPGGTSEDSSVPDLTVVTRVSILYKFWILSFICII